MSKIEGEARGPVINKEVVVHRISNEGSGPIAPLIDPTRTVVNIEDNAYKQHEIYTREIIHELLTKVLLGGPPSPDPDRRALEELGKARVAENMYRVINPVVRRCITSTQRAILKRAGIKIMPGENTT